MKTLESERKINLERMRKI